MVSRKIWTDCSIKLENKLYPYALTGNIPEKPKLENTENINKITKLVPLPLKGVRGMSAISINYPITKGKV